MKTYIVIPAYNEEKTIEEVITKSKKYGSTVVVDDGSTDSTYGNAKSADYLLRHIVNMGKGVALKTGIESAIKKDAKIIVTIDADSQHDPKDIPRLVELLKKEDLDIVLGSRPVGTKMPLIMKFGNIFLYTAFRILFHANIKDTQSGFRAFKSNIYKKIEWESSSYSVETEMLVNVEKYKLKYKEIPIETKYPDRHKGTTVIDGVKIFLNMLYWKIIK